MEKPQVLDEFEENKSNMNFEKMESSNTENMYIFSLS